MSARVIDSVRTTLYIIVVSLCTEVLKVWQAIQSYSLQLVQVDFSVAVLIHEVENSVDDVVRLLLVLTVVLRVQSESMSITRTIHDSQRTFDFLCEYI